MPTVCLHCSMRAMLKDEPPPLFDESPDDHRRRAHPDPVTTALERVELERRLREKLNPNGGSK